MKKILFLLLAFTTLAIAQTVNWKEVDSTGAILSRQTSPTNRLVGVTPAAGIMVSSNGVITSVQGTAGSVAFWGSTTNLTQDNANLFWDDANNRLGIGTTTPGVIVHIKGTNALFKTQPAADDGQLNGYYVSASSGAGAVVGGLTVNTATGEVAVGSLNASYFTSLYGGSVERVRIVSAGNLLLGTTAAGTSASNVFAIKNGTAPTTRPADIFQLVSLDIAGAGDAGPNIYPEGGGVYRFGTNGLFGGSLTVTNSVTIGALQTGATPIAWSGGTNAVLDFGSITTLTNAILTITVTGAGVGDNVVLGLPAAPQSGIAWNAYVSATNTVSVQANNVTIVSLDPAPATYNVRLFRN